MILRTFSLLAALLPFAFADVKITVPSGGETITGDSLTITWTESGTAPPITEFASYSMTLCAGGNTDDEYIPLYTLVASGDYQKGSTVTATFPLTIGGNTENAYFVKVLSAATGGSIINFSDRFTLASMTGVFPASVIAGLKTVSGTAGPATVNEITTPQNNPAANPAQSIDSASFAIPFAEQSGEVRYAPMPKTAPTKITAKNVTPLYPTSHYDVYVSAGGPADCTLTATEGINYPLTTRENNATPAPQPSNDMQKFLARWRD